MRKATVFATWVLLITGMSLAATFGTAIAKEDIYRWVDENGVVHFGNQAEAGDNAELVKVQKGSPPPQETAQPQASEPASDTPSYAQQRREERAKAKQESARKREELEKECEWHRGVVAKLEPMPRVIVQQEDGTMVRMDDNERLEKIRESKEFIAKNCD